MTQRQLPDLGNDPFERLANLIALIASKLAVSIQSFAVVAGLIFVLIVTLLMIVFRFVIPGGS